MLLHKAKQRPPDSVKVSTRFKNPFPSLFPTFSRQPNTFEISFSPDWIMTFRDFYSSSNGSDETCVREGKEQRQHCCWRYLFAVDVTVEPSLAVGINRCVESEEDAEQCYESRGAKACAGDGASAAGRWGRWWRRRRTFVWFRTGRCSREHRTYGWEDGGAASFSYGNGIFGLICWRQHHTSVI